MNFSDNHDVDKDFMNNKLEFLEGTIPREKPREPSLNNFLQQVCMSFDKKIKIYENKKTEFKAFQLKKVTERDSVSNFRFFLIELFSKLERRIMGYKIKKQCLINELNQRQLNLDILNTEYLSLINPCSLGNSSHKRFSKHKILSEIELLEKTHLDLLSQLSSLKK